MIFCLFQRYVLIFGEKAMPPLPQNSPVLIAPAYPTLQHYAHDVKFSWASECMHLFSFRTLHIIGWPLFALRQRRLDQLALLKSCNAIPGFSDLWRTIQKGSFAYNRLFLRANPFHSPATDLADITTLALFFGDEFIDGIAGVAGKPVIRQFIKNDPDRFYLKKKIASNKVLLQYRFNLKRLLHPGIWKQVNAKYQINYQQFYDLLGSFLQLINKQLGKLAFTIAEKTADKIADACNTCFDSFLHDVNSCPETGKIVSPPSVQNFHELKTAYMQIKLLELRCILTGKEEAMLSVQSRGWVDIMRVIQIYDDIHDAAIDAGIQDNLFLSIASYYFPVEWEWFILHKHKINQQKQNPVLLSLYMPCTMEHCLRLAADKIKTMNWEQQKIMHYLLFKNQYLLFTERDDKDLTTRNSGFLEQFYDRIKIRMPHLSQEAIRSYAIDTCVHLPGIRKQLLGKIGFSMAYQLRYNLLSVPTETKAAVFEKMRK